jgi:hypothetical protein
MFRRRKKIKNRREIEKKTDSIEKNKDQKRSN